jgi:hypothetical protein
VPTGSHGARPSGVTIYVTRDLLSRIDVYRAQKLNEGFRQYENGRIVVDALNEVDPHEIADHIGAQRKPPPGSRFSYHAPTRSRGNLPPWQISLIPEMQDELDNLTREVVEIVEGEVTRSEVVREALDAFLPAAGRRTAGRRRSAG